MKGYLSPYSPYSKAFEQLAFPKTIYPVNFDQLRGILSFPHGLRVPVAQDQQKNQGICGRRAIDEKIDLFG